MFLKDTGQRKFQYRFVYLSAAIHEFWIAAFFYSTNFERFLYFFLEYKEAMFVCAPATERVCFLGLNYRGIGNGLIRCRSPPSDFDFAYQLKKSKLEDDL